MVCREHINQKKHSDFKQAPVLICSLPCFTQVDCLISEAARATSAAITYFPPQKIGDRLFADGGLEYNNPSHAIYDHYDESIRSGHGHLSFTNVRIINIGTCTKTDQLLLSQPSDNVYVPAAYRMFTFIKRILVEAAVNAERVDDQMKTLARTNKSAERVIKFERFSADNGVCFLKLDKYKALGLVESLTEKYLKNPEVASRLQVLGTEIAREYLEQRRSETSTIVPPTEISEVNLKAATAEGSLPSLVPPNSTPSIPKSAVMANGTSIINGNETRTQDVHEIIPPVEANDSQLTSPIMDVGHYATGSLTPINDIAVVS